MSTMQAFFITFLVSIASPGQGQMADNNFFQNYIEDAKRLADVEWMNDAIYSKMAGTSNYIALTEADVHRNRFLLTLLSRDENGWNLWYGGNNRGSNFQIQCRASVVPEKVENILGYLPSGNLNDVSNVGKILHGEVVSMELRIGEKSLSRRYYFNSGSKGQPSDLVMVRKQLHSMIDDCITSVRRASK